MSVGYGQNIQNLTHRLYEQPSVAQPLLGLPGEIEKLQEQIKTLAEQSKQAEDKYKKFQAYASQRNEIRNKVLGELIYGKEPNPLAAIEVLDVYGEGLKKTEAEEADEDLKKLLRAYQKEIGDIYIGLHVRPKLESYLGQTAYGHESAVEAIKTAMKQKEALEKLKPLLEQGIEKAEALRKKYTG